MRLNHPDLLNNGERLFHVSEEPGIDVFKPRPSPSYFEGINNNVVFAIAERLLHNYLLPRDCPRVTWYADPQSTATDKQRFAGFSAAEFFIAVEPAWYQRIKQTILYCYEFSPADFTLVDACAGYYVSYRPVVPLSVISINDIMAELLSRNIELRFTPSLIQLAGAVSASTLNFSLIRMRNAQK